MRSVLASGLLTAWIVACGSGDPTVESGDGFGGESGGGMEGDAGEGGTLASGGSGIALGGDTSFGGAPEGGSGGTSFKECAESEDEGELTPANLLFVLDRSGSMNCNPPEYGQTSEQCEIAPQKLVPEEPSKWEIVRDALDAALDDLADQPNVNAGVVAFPKADENNQCAVAVAPDVPIEPLSATHRQSISDFLDASVPKGKTPIAGSTILSYAFLSERLRAGELSGNTFLVLFTDGADTCELEDSGVLETFVETHVPNATLFNIRTFVIGAPGSEGARRLLSAVAFNGNTASDPNCQHESAAPDEGDCHFDMTTTDDFAAELSQALSDISSDKALSCVFEVPKNESGGGVNLNQVNVTFVSSGGETENVLKDDTAACDQGAEGWQYSDDRTQIVLCGEICERVQTDPGGQVRVVLGCPTVVVK